MNEREQSIHERIMGARQAAEAEGAVELEAMPSRPARKRRSALLAAVAVFVAFVGGGFGLYQVPVISEAIAQMTGRQPAEKSQKGRSPPQTAQEQAATADPFAKHAADAGIQTCAATYAGLGKALTGGTQYMVQSETGKTDADGHSLQGLVGMTFDNGGGSGYSGPAAGLVFAAPTPQGCEGTMVRVVPFQQSCQDAAALLPQGSQQLQPLAGVPVFSFPTGGQAMLLPSGQGCTALSIVRYGG